MSESKTPVTLLQELCVKKKESAPHYEFIGEKAGLENEKFFTYRVSCFGHESCGTGKAKKDAKHDAACNMLKLLANHMPDLQDLKISPSHSLERDAVSELLNICVQRNLPKADFVLESASGPSHLPEFRMCCSVATMKKTATHSTKKGAKQLAAQKMLAIIQEMPCLDESIMQIATVEDMLKSEEQTNHKTFKTYREYKNSDNKKQLGVKICDRHNFFKEIEPELQAKCRAVVYDTGIHDTSEKVQLMMKELDLQYEIRDVDGIERTMRSFELVGADFDVYLLADRAAIYERIFSYLKIMLSI